MPAGPDPVSKALFGNGHFLLVGCTLRPRTSPFYAREVAAETGLPDKTVGEILKRMTAAGLVQKLPTADTKQYFERVDDHPMWVVFPSLDTTATARGGKGSEASHRPSPVRRQVLSV
jgi:hypothetical protein